MVASTNTVLVLHNLVEQWAARLPVLGAYLEATFSYRPVEPIKVKRLFIAEMADGDVMNGNIGGLYAMKWVLKGGILEPVSLDYAYDEMYETDQTESLYLSPSYLFCHQDDVVLLSERYGPSLKHRLRGRLVSIDKQPTIQWETIWR